MNQDMKSKLIKLKDAINTLELVNVPNNLVVVNNINGRIATGICSVTKALFSLDDVELIIEFLYQQLKVVDEPRYNELNNDVSNLDYNYKYVHWWPIMYGSREGVEHGRQLRLNFLNRVIERM